MQIRRVNGSCAPGEINFEAWFLFASVILAVGCFCWLGLGLPWPHCWVRHTFGFPCPTCGSTRCALALAHGNVGSALRLNPMIFTAYLGIGVFDVYAIGALWFGLPRLRLTDVPSKIKQVFSLLLIIAATGNWIYLLTKG
jgi:Protein of unknown function (DUF2752)